ncbi:TonB-dependent receptor P3 [Bacteroides pyogenes]|uniref:TonB-dependent receptor n=1 Tax=Bacteroides pyogenes TaxID=310300 RepID=A0A5D3ETH1_9BACE|nr:TonB-dependent receptor [Bacteroides pyogenes]MBR8705606.1 TonB-dependent receptor P3 [Bacteroides pyogenes]MBR8719737.1 TonB-dependent receptor P3 [Bacteroides pyogenes]MBR8724937.1 TonB-dependent receptor P3 [Bacteroides pyogenes]MBR8738476.1 TonB-dependent receptor P3 [Bacteroides pyogenes]MBR8754159.1 TonB-dependent receptor P3 [Bacteroides pyogenes]
MRKNFCKICRGHCSPLFWIISLLLWGNVAMAALPVQHSKFSMQKRSVSLSAVFREIEKQTGYSFLVRNNDVDINQKISIDVENKSVEEVLEILFAGKNIRYEVDKKQISVYTPRQVKQGTVTGQVLDVSKEPIIGASVIVVGSTNGTITNFDGKFALEVTSFPVKLQVSYIGYKTQEIMVSDTKAIQVIMSEDTETLEEVVVVGYGSQKKANLTGAVASVKMDEVMANRPLSKAADALQGTVPGLLISSNGNAPGKSKSFQIRGAYSVGIKNADGSYGGTIKPLVLIDNVEGDLDLINPEDIETITVLKDAASAAIYGARAAGGVILVTTKRPKGATTFQLNYNNNFAFASAVNLPEQAPLTDYLKAYSHAAGDQFWTIGAPSVSKWLGYLEQYRSNPSSIKVEGDGLYKDADGAVYYLNEKDLVKNMLETSFQQTHNISMTGGTDKLRYRLSAGYINHDGVLITDKDKYRRMNVSGFISTDITGWLTQEATFSYAHSKNLEPRSPLGAVYSTRLASFYPEGSMPKGMSDKVSDDLPFFTPSNQIRWSNPAKTLYDNPRIFLKSIFKPLKGFEAIFEYTYDKNIYDYHWYTGSVAYTTVQGGRDVTPTNDYLQKTKRYTDYNSINLYGSYDFQLSDHKFKVMAGFNQESSYSELMEALSYGQAVIEVPSLGSGTSTLRAVDQYNEYSVRGGFFRVNYNYMDRYLMEVNGRYDGSSKFPKDSRFGFFPSVSLGWNVAQEKFMENIQSWLGALKIRASYGMIGNQNVPAYSFIPTMSVNNKYNGWLVDGNRVTAITSIPSLVSNNFTWEKVGTVDVGLDFSMFNNRFTGTFDWYQRNTDGMLAPGMQLPDVVGADAPYQNTADMRTRGWELSLNYRDQIGKVGYRIGLNISDNKSKITKYDSNSSYILSSQRRNAQTGGTYTFWDFYEGKDLGEIWGYEFDGFYDIDDFVDTSSWKLKDGVPSIDGYNPRPGDVKFKNLMDDDRGTNLISSGDNTLNNPGDRKVIGNTTPRYLYGINLGVNYKGLDLNIFMQGTGRRDAWIANNLVFPMYSDYKFIPLYKGLGNYWQPVDAANGNYAPVNPNAEFPRIYGNYGNQGSNYRPSDKYLSDASYFRIKNMTLAYTFPKVWTSKLSLSQLKAFVSVENLATFSSLPKGIDPETLRWDYPAFRTVSFGFNITL